MAACKPLNKQEISLMLETFTGRAAIRNVALLTIGIQLGFRISELLSLRVADVLLRGRIRDSVTVGKSRTKGQRSARTVPLGPEAKQCVERLLTLLRKQGRFDMNAPLFQGQKRKGRAITRAHAAHVLRAAADKAGIPGQVGTHSLRKTFAHNTHNHLSAQQRNGVRVDPLIAVSRALGHRSLQSTASYLPFAEQCISEAILSLSSVFDSAQLTEKLASKTKQKTAQFTEKNHASRSLLSIGMQK